MIHTEITTQRVVSEAEGHAERIEHRTWFRILARVGLVARSIIYILIAYLTADIALHGASPVPADSTGALKQIALEPAGPAILLIVAVGLVGYALWRLVSAMVAADLHGHAWAKRVGRAASGIVYLGLCGQAVSVAIGSGQTHSVSTDPAPVAATVLRWPGGPLFLGFVAVALLGGGSALLIWGWLHDYARTLDRNAMTHRLYGIVRTAGIIGDTTRGLLIGLIGIYFMTSAVSDNPEKVKGLDQALQALAHKPFGMWLLGLASAGIFSFGLYSAFEARYRRI
jgi:hypothetical protein